MENKDLVTKLSSEIGTYNQISFELNTLENFAELLSNVKVKVDDGDFALSEISRLPSIVTESLRKEGLIGENGDLLSFCITSDTLDKGKKTLACLRAFDKGLEEGRKDVKKRWNRVYDIFNQIYESNKVDLTRTITNLDSDVKAVETDISNSKRNGFTLDIQKDADSMRVGLGDLVKDNPALWSRVWSESYLNKTMSNTKVCETYRTALRDIMTELETIEASEDREKLLQAYYRLGNLTLALAEVQKFKELEKKFKTKTEEIKPVEEVKEEPKEEEEFTYKSFRCWHKDPQAFRGLIQYMKDNGFHCEILK